MSFISRPSSRESRITKYFTPAPTPKPSIHSRTPPPVTPPPTSFGTWDNESRPTSALPSHAPSTATDKSVPVDANPESKMMHNNNNNGVLETRTVHFCETQEQRNPSDTRLPFNPSTIVEKDTRAMLPSMEFLQDSISIDADHHLLQGSVSTSAQHDPIHRDYTTSASLNTTASTPDSLANHYTDYYDNNSFSSKEVDNDNESRGRRGRETWRSGLPSNVATPASTIIRHRTPQVRSLMARRLPEFPVRTMCPHCSRLVTTETRPRRGVFAFLMSAIL
ncbi:hypothetical protein BC938DRAFT_482238 [Jimgerdemannia flammicorona]|uniref:LITAF domain-containing protein n=1 Tax=Jimgerdemannia flammicorona TaxID=994334 RepID=A0A433QWL5_9FUNG|nr:hypothetical protein BC938DRAFT_482238 [Jimgerdemannia flammicorona]